MSKDCKHEGWNPCGNDFYSCRKCGILRTSQQVNLYAEKDRQISDLEAKLAEKEEKIEEVKKWWAYQYNREMKNQHQEKISFAVEKLEEARKFAEDMWGIYKAEEEIEEFIKGQIKQLKEGGVVWIK